MNRHQIAKLVTGLVSGAAAVNIITLLINYSLRGQWLPCMPELINNMGQSRAVILQTVLGGLFGMVALGGTCVYDIEKWSLLRASLVHCLLILITYINVGLVLYWLSFHIIPILIMSGIIILVYALIWLVMYTRWKREIREINMLVEKYKKEFPEEYD